VNSGTARRIALVAQTPADARDVMVEGPSGVLNVGLPHERPKYEPSKRRITWPNGATATVYSGHEPDKLRGPEHDTAWCDELAAWDYPREAWSNLRFGLRVGDSRTCITTTPRPIPLLREILKSDLTVITGGSTYENLENLSGFYKEIVKQYENTSLGEQELWAQMLDEMPGALWKRKVIESSRMKVDDPQAWAKEHCHRIVVSIDPAITSTEESDETGIIVSGVFKGKNNKDEGVVLADLSDRYSPDGWARRAAYAYKEWGADRIIAEKNQGGDMVSHTIRMVNPNLPIKLVWAAKGKHTRAEPVAALYEQNRAHNVGIYPQLEDECCTWLPGEDSPSRMDAMVWGLSELMVHDTGYDLTSMKFPSLGTEQRWDFGG